MFKNLTLFVLSFLFLVTSLNLFAQDKTDRRPAKEKWSLASIEAKVEAINKEKRTVDLRGPLGNLVTITADESVERFAEIKVGDIVTADYWIYMLAEFRNPTPQELAEPLLILAESAKAPEGFDPGAVVGAIVKAVVTIEVLNRPYMLATIRGPGGNYMTIQMEDTELITELNIGQVVILTYAEAIAVSLNKVNSEE